MVTYLIELAAMCAVCVDGMSCQVCSMAVVGYLIGCFAGMLLQSVDHYQTAINITVDGLVTEAVDQMMTIRKQKHDVTDEAVRDEMEQQHSQDTVQTPARPLLAPLSTSTPLDVCQCCAVTAVLFNLTGCQTSSQCIYCILRYWDEC